MRQYHFNLDVCEGPNQRLANVFIALRMHQPGIEPGSVPWQGTILPLDHWCFVEHAYLT